MVTLSIVLDRSRVTNEHRQFMRYSMREAQLSYVYDARGPQRSQMRIASPSRSWGDEDAGTPQSRLEPRPTWTRGAIVS